MNWKLFRILVGSFIIGTVIVLASVAFEWSISTELLLTIPGGTLLAIIENWDLLFKS